jgi:N-acetylneuraminic acid mutarotase
MLDLHYLSGNPFEKLGIASSILTFDPTQLFVRSPSPMMFDAMLSQLETDLRAALGTCVTELVATTRRRLEGAHADLANERAEGLAEVAEERTKALVEVDARRAELGREVEAMHMHREAQQGHVELNIGGYRYETSVQTLRRVPHTFFDAYFSGRYAQDVCNDGSIFVDRDGEHFGHILQYMRDGVVSVAEDGACPSMSLLRALKREFGFYCIELSTDEPVAPEHFEIAFAIGGFDANMNTLASMERYDTSSGLWSIAAAMGTGRTHFGMCAVEGIIYVTGGREQHYNILSSVEKYTPSTNTWSFVSNLPEPRSDHVAVTVGPAMYVLGGGCQRNAFGDATTSVCKYDSVQGTWSEVAPMPEGRCDFAACAVGNNIYVIGGYDVRNGISSEQQTVFKYDTETDEWSTLTPMIEGQHGHSAIELNGLIFIVGANDIGMELLCFDPASGVWSSLARLLHEHYHGASFVLGGCLYAAGGETSGGSNVERYDVASDTWTEVVDMLESRDNFCAVTIGSAGPAVEQDLFDALIAKASN